MKLGAGKSKKKGKKSKSKERWDGGVVLTSKLHLAPEELKLKGRVLIIYSRIE